MNLGYKSAAFAALTLTIASANAVTFATFADPSPNGSQPLFTATQTTASTISLAGGWSGTGLTLQMPISANSFTNATFSMPTVTGTGTLNSGALGPGSVSFDSSGGAALFTIDFTSAQMSITGFGTTTFMALNGVTFTGPQVPSGVVGQSFAFSFANQTQTSSGAVTATASFTSSSVPEPASFAAIGAGLIGILRRRQRR